MKPDDKKIKAISRAAPPKNQKELRSFLGLCSYRKFIRNFATIAGAMNDLLGKEVPFKWERAQDEAFQELKKKLTTTPILSHFDEKSEIVQSCDASDIGIGGVQWLD